MVWGMQSLCPGQCHGPRVLAGELCQGAGGGNVNGPRSPREGGRPLSPCPAGTCLLMTYGISVHKLSVGSFPPQEGLALFILFKPIAHNALTVKNT